jgi:hypothetical protein
MITLSCFDIKKKIIDWQGGSEHLEENGKNSKIHFTGYLPSYR